MKKMHNAMGEFVAISRMICRNYEIIPFTISLVTKEGERKLYMFEDTDFRIKARIWDAFAFILNIYGARCYSFLYQTDYRRSFVGIGHVTPADKKYTVFRLTNNREIFENTDLTNCILTGKFFNLFELAKRFALSREFPVNPIDLRLEYEQATFKNLLGDVKISRELRSDHG